MMDRDAHVMTDGKILRKLWQLQRNKGDEPTVKLGEIAEAKLMNSEQQHGFMPRKSATDAMCALGLLCG